MAVMHALYEEKKDFYNWQVENGSGYLVSVSEKEWENGIELLKNAEPVKDYGEFSFFPVYGGKLKKYRVEIKR